MKRIFMASIFFFALAPLSGLTADPQSAKPVEPGRQNRITLQSGDVIYDLNGRWDALYELWDVRKRLQTVVHIRQKGDQFVIIRPMEGPDRTVNGQEIFRGALDKAGISKAEFKNGATWDPATGVIAQNGNMIMLLMEAIEGTLTLWRK